MDAHDREFVAHTYHAVGKRRGRERQSLKTRPQPSGLSNVDYRRYVDCNPMYIIRFS